MRPAGRIFLALSALALAAGVWYAIYSQELAGSVMLGVFAVALAYIATVLIGAGAYDRAENEPDAEPEVGPEHRFPPSWWPVIMAAGAGAALLGIKFSAVVMVIGFAVFLAAVVGWFVQAGRHAAERARHAEHAGHGEAH